MLNVVLVEPEIPPNTGNIARLCAATDTILHLVKPLGFSTDNKQLKRAGLDYWEFVKIIYWENFEELFNKFKSDNNFYFLTTKVNKKYTEVKYRDGDFLVFGKETKGLPEELLNQNHKNCVTIPQTNKKIVRSLNLATAVGIVLYEAIRQLGDGQC